MKERVQGAVTAGVALVGVGVVAASPVAQQAPEVVKAAEADVQLAAYDQGVPALFALSAQRGVTGLATTPIGLATAAAALAQGKNTDAQGALSQIVDGPLWAVDPAIYALDDLLPEPIGGDDANEPTTPDPDSAISQFRAAVLVQGRDDINAAIEDALGVGTAGNDVSPTYAAARVGAGLAMSGVRAAQSAVSAPLGLVAVAQGLQKSFEGDNTDLYKALQAYIDGPNYVADPIVFAADDVLPKPIGGDPETDPAKMDGSAISKFRGNVLLAPRDNVRKVVAGALGVNPVTGDETNKVANNVARTTNTQQRVSLNTTVKNTRNEIKAAADKFERRVQKLTSLDDKKPAAKPKADTSADNTK
ncbi:hypothetical protein [Mycobacterium sp. 1274761.0]|uniref:hypothetical protein n=1 Tax=Mycobacterium sp. 1274761.0 TaxID=1834077 RepID=UPI00080192D6|nr:hypothetical protein [Mycobacterium sp. 1274761.0]OBK73820.1 hypothetical protein A5651_12925 [Mycobacterium sp. 1274761.0]